MQYKNKKPGILHNNELTGYSQKLRKEMTKEERHLWYDFLTSLPYTIKRQETIGQYIIDFYCSKAKLAIELDGSQHYERTGKRSDEVRDHRLNALGIKVLRYSNLDINRNFRGVCEDILNQIELRIIDRISSGGED